MNNEIRTGADDKLDQLLGKLSQDVQPSRDLWHGIQANLTPHAQSAPRRSFGLLGKMAAGFVLIAVSSFTTYVVTRSINDRPMINATIGNDSALVKEYLRARTELDRQFAERIAQLPASTRAQLESSLADLRRAESEIVAGLSASPSDPLLQELLLSTFQSESQLLADITELHDSTATSTDTPRSPT